MGFASLTLNDAQIDRITYRCLHGICQKPNWMNPFLIVQASWNVSVIFCFVIKCVIVLLVCIPVELYIIALIFILSMPELLLLHRFDIYTFCFVVVLCYFIPAGIRLIHNMYLYTDRYVMVYFMLLFCMGANNNLYVCNRR